MEITLQTNNVKITPKEYLMMFNLFSESDKHTIFQNLYKVIFKKEWNVLDDELPDVEMSEDEIMKEVSAVRYGNDN